MRILHVISGMDPQKGGVSQALRTMITELSQQNVQNEVVSMDDPNAPFLSKDNFTVHALGAGFSRWSYNPKMGKWLKAHIAEYDSVVVHGLWQYHSYAATAAIKSLTGNKPKFFVMPHGMLDPYFQKASARRVKAVRNWFFWKLVEEKIIKVADGLLFTCETEKILARKTFTPYKPKSEKVVGLGVEVPPAYRQEMTESFLAKAPELGNAKYLLYISRIHEKKSVDLLIKAYILAKQTYLEVPKLVIAGPGLETKYGQRIQKLASVDKDIHFTGMLYDDEKWGAFYGCEAFILPSHQENFGIAVVEALSCGKPVLISNQINIWREIANAGAGIIANDTQDGTEYLLNQWIQMTPEDKSEMIGKTKTAFTENFAGRAAADRLVLALGS